MTADSVPRSRVSTLVVYHQAVQTTSNWYCVDRAYDDSRLSTTVTGEYTSSLSPGSPTSNWYCVDRAYDDSRLCTTVTGEYTSSLSSGSPKQHQIGTVLTEHMMTADSVPRSRVSTLVVYHQAVQTTTNRYCVDRAYDDSRLRATVTGEYTSSLSSEGPTSNRYCVDRAYDDSRLRPTVTGEYTSSLSPGSPNNNK